MLQGWSRTRLWSELAGILHELVKRENTMGECLRVFQTRLHVLLGGTKLFGCFKLLCWMVSHQKAMIK